MDLLAHPPTFECVKCVGWQYQGSTVGRGGEAPMAMPLPGQKPAVQIRAQHYGTGLDWRKRNGHPPEFWLGAQGAFPLSGVKKWL